MSYEPTGKPLTGVSSKGSKGILEAYSPLTEGSGGDISGYVSLLRRQGPVVSSTPVPEKPGAFAGRSSAPARRDEIRRCLIKAAEAAGNLETHAGAGEKIDLSNEGFRLMQLLDDLWQLRSEREDNWGDLLNILQGALKQEEFERFSVEQCQAIHAIVADHLGAGAVGDDDIERSVELLRESGLDPWRGISGF